MNAAEIDAMLLRFACKRLEWARDDYARAATEWTRTRALPRETSGYWRGAKMSATYQLKKATGRLAAILTEEG